MTNEEPPGLYDDANKQVVLRRGGWFVTGTSWSGPWDTEEAANFAKVDDFDAAHRVEKALRR